MTCSSRRGVGGGDGLRARHRNGHLLDRPHGKARRVRGDGVAGLIDSALDAWSIRSTERDGIDTAYSLTVQALSA
jgi:hypothetical protein